MTVPLFAMSSVSKRFGATIALENVSFAVERGEVRALIGENGAGKSTLMRVLAGVHTPDAGSMQMDGAPYAPHGPADARAAGIAMIHQELSIAPDLSVEANVMLGRERSRAGFVKRAEHRRIVRDSLKRLAHGELDPDARAGDLPIALQQQIEIARALASDARVIVFDEPTSSLGREDSQRLFAVIRELRAQGIGIVYISHFLEETAQVSDTYTVLRDGRVAAEGRMSGTSLDVLVRHMVGRELGEMFPRVPHAIGAPMLEVRGLCGVRSPRSVDLTLRRGEIVGLAGLVGAGRSELLRCIFGLDPVRSGAVRVAELPSRGASVARGASYSRGASSTQGASSGRGASYTQGSTSIRGSKSANARSPRASIASGIGFVSEDRKGEGLALSLSIEDNLTLTRLEPYARFGWLGVGRRRSAAREWMQRARIKADSPARAVESLSGGNQQKVAIARLLHQDAEILLLDEPTRGIDVGTKSEIYRLIGELAAQGKCVIVASSYLPELLGVCDTVAVMCRGEIVAVREAERWNEEDVMLHATGAASLGEVRT